MDERTSFLILSRACESEAIPIAGQLGITVPRGIQKDPKFVKGLICEVGQTFMILDFERLLHAS